MKFLFALLLFIFSRQANACDCNSIRGLKEADVAFKGKVAQVQRVEEPYIRYEITFQVNKWIKGKKQEKTIVIDVPCLQVACCGINFQKGEVYQVYAYTEDKRLETSLCWATRKIK